MGQVSLAERTMKVNIVYFVGKEVERVYIASSVEEAERAEKILDGTPFIYAIDLEPFARPISFLFGGTRIGAAFYVAPPYAEECWRLLSEHGLSAEIADDQ